MPPCDFGDDVGKIEAPTQEEDSFTAALLVWGLNVGTFPVRCFHMCLCEATMKTFYTSAVTDVDIMYRSSCIL